MSVYIIILNYKVPFEKIMEMVPEHREYLNKYYEDETILFSGVKCSYKGGVIVMKANSEEEVKNLIESDPFNQRSLVDYDYICMESRRHQPFIDEWINEK